MSEEVKMKIVIIDDTVTGIDGRTIFVIELKYVGL